MKVRQGNKRGVKLINVKSWKINFVFVLLRGLSLGEERVRVVRAMRV